MIELALIILKFTSIALTGFFGLYGLLNDFKDKNKKITKHGKIALRGIIISTIISVLTYTFEIYKNESDTLAAIKRNTEMLQEINRAVQPKIEKLLIWWTLEVSLNNDIFTDYKLRLKKLKDVNELEKDNEINKDSSLLNPLNEVNGIVQKFFHQLYGTLYFFRTPIPKNVISSLVNSDTLMNKAADLKFNFGFFGMEQHYSFKSDINSMEIMGRDNSEKSGWFLSGKILSMPDLYGSQLIYCPQIVEDINRPEVQKIKILLNSIRLSQLTILFPSYKINIPTNKLRKVINNKGVPYFVYDFPTSREGFLEIDTRFYKPQ